jgi:outer membrane receptor for ferrienterochelin and colicins
MYKPGNFTLRASWAKGFRQPGLKDLYFDFVDINHNIHGNTALKAESSDNWLGSAGYTVRQGNAYWRFNVSGWYNNVRDLITLVLKPGGTANEYWYQNISHFVTKGMQVNADVQTGRWALSAGGSCMGTYNQLSETVSVPAFSYSPEVRGSITRTFPWHSLSLSAFYKYTGRAVVYVLNSDTNTPEQSRMGSYHMADVTVSGKVWQQRVTLAGGCKNLFDVTNIVSGGGDGSAHSSAATTAAIGMGRYFFVRTEIRLHSKG